MREKPSRMPPSVATEPPLKPVPAPRATRGRLCRSANFAICTTCSVCAGKNHGVRLPHGGKRVVLVEHQVFLTPQYAVLAYDPGKLFGKPVGFHTDVRGKRANAGREMTSRLCMPEVRRTPPPNPLAQYISPPCQWSTRVLIVARGSVAQKLQRKFHPPVTNIGNFLQASFV